MNPTIDPNLYPYQNLLANLQGGAIPAELAALIDSQTGSVNLGGLIASAGDVRELDPYTGARHWQYATPGGSAPNANIWNVAPGEQTFLGADTQPAAEQPVAPSWLPTMDANWTPQMQSQWQMGQTPAALGQPLVGQQVGAGNVGHAPVDWTKTASQLSESDPGGRMLSQFAQFLRSQGVKL